MSIEEEYPYQCDLCEIDIRPEGEHEVQYGDLTHWICDDCFENNNKETFIENIEDVVTTFRTAEELESGSV